MNNAKVFQERNIIATCDYINKYCELYVINASNMESENVKSFHNYLPTLLVHIFGSPTTRGWIQTETQPAQDAAIAQLLSVGGHFFQALVKLSRQAEYCYDLVTDSLPADVKKVLSSGTIHLLPQVYQGCSYLVTTSNNNSIDIRAAATRQSTLLPPTIGGDRKIRFNMLQFFLYYFVSVATWPPLVEPTPIISNRTPQYGNARPPTTNTIPNTSNTNTPNTMINNNTTNTNNTTHNGQPSAISGRLRSITQSAYDQVLGEYLNRFIPIKSEGRYIPIVGSFFFDACAELWIRTTWITTNAKLSSELMHYISFFIKYIVRHDLKQCLAGEASLLKDIYTSLKDEVYTLISRLALNWSKHDSYIQVIELWCIWAAPWKLGAEPRSSEKIDYRPIQSGWCTFILDNLPYYFTLVDIFLERTSTFMYKENVQTATNVPVSTYSDGSITGQLRILYRLINVMKASGLVDYLGLIEKSFLKVNSSTNKANQIIKELATQSYGSDKMDRLVYEKMLAARELLRKLEGVQGVWKPKGLYSNDLNPRADSLLKTLNALNNAALARESAPMQPAMNNAVSAEKAAKYASQLREAYQLVHITFKVVGDDHLNSKNLNPKDSKASTQFPTSSTRRSRYKKPTYIGQNSDKPLTPEEVQLIYEGKAICCRDNVPAVGQRAITFVRSYEVPILVSWVLRLDVPLNEYYNKYLPKHRRPSFMRDKLTLRPLARQSNFLFFVSTLLLFFLLIVKLIF